MARDPVGSLCLDQKHSRATRILGVLRVNHVLLALCSRQSSVACHSWKIPQANSLATAKPSLSTSYHTRCKGAPTCERQR